MSKMRIASTPETQILCDSGESRWADYSDLLCHVRGAEAPLMACEYGASRSSRWSDAVLLRSRRTQRTFCNSGETPD